MECEHHLIHVDEEACYLACSECDYAEPCGSFDCLCLHDQVVAIQFERDRETQL